MILHGKTIVVGITGSMAAIEAPKIVRELKRRGANVFTVISKDAKEIINPNVLKWASQNDVIEKIDGSIQHIDLLGLDGSADLYLIAPATANTISKIAQGIDDSAVTTFATTACGAKKPIIIAPAMHLGMYEHPILHQNIDKLYDLGFTIIYPKNEEGIAKLADVNQIVDEVERKLYPKDLQGKKILVTAGPTIEHIDPIRVITNKSSGKMGYAIAKEAYYRDAQVTLLRSSHLPQPTFNCRDITFTSITELKQHLLSSNVDAIIHAAAVGDFEVQPQTRKLESKETHQIKLTPSEKLVEKIKQQNSQTKLVAFKAEWGADLHTKATDLQERSSADLVVANDIQTHPFGSDETSILLLKNNLSEEFKGSKQECAKKYLMSYGNGLRSCKY